MVRLLLSNSLRMVNLEEHQCRECHWLPADIKYRRQLCHSNNTTTKIQEVFLIVCIDSRQQEWCRVDSFPCHSLHWDLGKVPLMVFQSWITTIKANHTKCIIIKGNPTHITFIKCHNNRTHSTHSIWECSLLRLKMWIWLLKEGRRRHPGVIGNGNILQLAWMETGKVTETCLTGEIWFSTCKLHSWETFTLYFTTFPNTC